MTVYSFVIFGLSWTEVSVLGSQLFVQASMEGCGYCGITSQQLKIHHTEDTESLDG